MLPCDDENWEHHCRASDQLIIKPIEASIYTKLYNFSIICIFRSSLQKNHVSFIRSISNGCDLDLSPLLLLAEDERKLGEQIMGKETEKGRGGKCFDFPTPFPADPALRRL